MSLFASFIGNRIDVLGTESFTYSRSAIEVDMLADALEKISFELKITATADGDSECKNKSIYFTRSDEDITEEKIRAVKEKATAFYQAMAAYVVVNRDE